MIQNKVINVADTTVFEAQKQSALTTVIFCNTGTKTDTLTVYIVKDKDTPSNNNITLTNLLSVADDTFVLDTERLILEAGDSLIAKSINGTTVATVSIMELV